MSPEPNTHLASETSSYLYNPRHFSAFQFVPAFWILFVSPKTRTGLLPNQKVITGSHRPISNLSYISKLVERVVVQRFTRHVSVHSLFPPQQSAYRPFHSTATAVLAVHNSLVRAVDEKHVSLLLLLDLSAAFDTVDHSILLSILEQRFSIRVLALDWFKSYSSDRTHTFMHANQTTCSFPVNILCCTTKIGFRATWLCCVH